MRSGPVLFLCLSFAMLWLPLGQHAFLTLHWMKVGTFMAPFLMVVAMSFARTTRLKDPRFIGLLMLTAYIGHQFEEHWIDLYGREFAFQSVVNQMLADALDATTTGGGVPDILTHASIFVINTSLVWLVGALAIWRGEAAIFPVLAMIAIALVNAISHIASSVALGAYNPGLATSVVLFIPLSLWAYAVLWRDGLADAKLIGWSIFWSVAAHAIMVLGLIAANWWQVIPEFVYFCVLGFWSVLPTVWSTLRDRAYAPTIVVLLCMTGWSAEAQTNNPISIGTESPRDTLRQLEHLGERLDARLAAYETGRSRQDYVAIRALMDAATDLFDLSNIPIAVRGHVGEETVVRVLDILAEHPPIDMSDVPGFTDLPKEGAYTYRIDGTPLRLRRLDEGQRQGDVLFDSYTIDRLTRNASLQLAEMTTVIKDEGRFSRSLAQLTGPLIPRWVSDIGSRSDGSRLFDTPIWKVHSASVILLATLAVLWLVHRAIARASMQLEQFKTFLNLLRPLSVLVASLALSWILNVELHLSGRLAIFVQTVVIANLHIAAAWAAWIVVRAIFDGFAASKDTKPGSIDVNMLHLIGRVTAAIIFVTILTIGAQSLGLPVLSILAGFGLGGLAIALAIRPTFENLIGGLILYIDSPIKVGDFCTFCTLSGSVERIGVRSTQIRALDRTLITVPNAQFADLQLVNWAACDMMQVTSALGFRYETDMDVLRDVLAEIRKMLHSHPRVDQDTVRVRFAGFGDYALKIDLRACIVTREWNEFFAIREDVFFRIGEIVSQSGTDFAFPSQTLYLQRGEGLENEKVDAAHERVESLKRRRRLPFPRFAEEDMTRFSGKLDYPTRGSPDFLSSEDDLMQGSETLSSDAPEDTDRMR